MDPGDGGAARGTLILSSTTREQTSEVRGGTRHTEKKDNSQFVCNMISKKMLYFCLFQFYLYFDLIF
jgi:hypothetical protein